MPEIINREDFFEEDEALKRELNERYGDEEVDGAGSPGRPKHAVIKLAALVVAVLFALTLAGSALRVFTLPSLDLLLESWELSRDPQVRELRRTVVRVEAVAAGSPGSTRQVQRGTGFNIKPSGLIVTNRHLVERADYITVSFAGQQGSLTAEDWRWSEQADLAVITLDGGELPVASLENGPPPDPGETVTVIGNPLSFSHVALRGPVRKIGPYRGLTHPIAVIEAPIHPGHSGSPVFNEAGRVVGILFASVTIDGSEERLGLAVPVDVISDFLDCREP